MELNSVEQALAAAGAFLAAWQRELSRSLALYLRQADSLDAAAWLAAGFAFVLGMLHAATPGHGKLVVFSYFFGRDARPMAGIAAALKIAATHIATAIALFAIADVTQTVFFGRAAGSALILQAVSYLAIVGIGAVLLYRSLRRPAEDSGPSSAALPFAVGLLPCPLTLLILSYALANASLAAGLVLVAVMGLGIALTIALVALLGMAARRTTRMAIGLDRYQGVMRALEIVSAALILVLGAVLLSRTLL
jgi:ABC-type nickel/cobalt efflux system permease component RcnA